MTRIQIAVLLLLLSACTPLRASVPVNGWWVLAVAYVAGAVVAWGVLAPGRGHGWRCVLTAAIDASVWPVLVVAMLIELFSEGP